MAIERQRHSVGEVKRAVCPKSGSRISGQKDSSFFALYELGRWVSDGLPRLACGAISFPVLGLSIQTDIASWSCDNARIALPVG